MAEKDQKIILYLLSGPLGVGKSTASKELASMMDRCVLIEGDHIFQVFKGDQQPSWEERLNLTWKNILALTRNFIQYGLNIVIDFVVEDELEWFCNHLSDLNIELRYVVLRADKEKIRERLNKRGDIHSLERSLFLMNKMETSSVHQPFIYDSTQKLPAEIARDIIDDARFIKKLN
ncbi:AAA family ATPase [Paenibacillus solisilvae]|uniref:AAA family ATPase n=1 Tax=Paenibacillus solisilvae TaxID=2486751 RepID=A0ABW0VUI0_9BACL